MNWSSSWEPFVPGKAEAVTETAKQELQKLIIGVDHGSPDGDKTIVNINNGNVLYPIGESIRLEIPIKGGWENNAVDAIKVGDLAVHKSLGWNEQYTWQVTHIPTLTMFDRAIPEGNWTQEQLIMWCWKVQQNYTLHWSELRMRDNSNYKELLGGDILNSLCEYCLTIPME